MEVELISITVEDIDKLHDFLKNAGSHTLNKFRYFNNRPKEIIKKHIITYMLIDEQTKKSIGYGHLDPEDNKIWLGIAISESEQGKGLGKMLMQKLLDTAKINKIDEIYLTVDKDNEIAIKLYKIFGFYIVKETASYYELKNSHK